jgi:hypothetical protein
LHDVRPGDAEALWAEAFARAGQRKEALEHLRRAFETWRIDPWAPVPLANAALHLALDLAGADRAAARTLYTTLREPFSVMQVNEYRLTTAVSIAAVAAASESDPIIAEAIGLYGRHFPWQKDLLKLRVVALRPKHPELAEGEAEPFAAGLPGLAAPSAKAPAVAAAEH